jgi:hypothetical protein
MAATNGAASNNKVDADMALTNNIIEIFHAYPVDAPLGWPRTIVLKSDAFARLVFTVPGIYKPLAFRRTGIVRIVPMLFFTVPTRTGHTALLFHAAIALCFAFS